MATAYDTWLTHDADGERAAQRGEAIDALVDKYRKDPKKLAEAEEWTAGRFDSEHYSAVSLALHALHRIEPDKLVGSDLLATLYRLAKVDHEAIEAQLRRMAEDEVDGQDNVMGASAARFVRLYGDAA
ncbi:MAG TPA: hypothetical protein VMA55_02735 [Acidovorax sp.]|nr:hypothetical protein [Acidovorax sp.]